MYENFTLDINPDDLPDLRSLIPQVADAVMPMLPDVAPAPLPAQEVPQEPVKSVPVPPVEAGPALPAPFDIRTKLAAGHGPEHIDGLHGSFRSSVEELLLSAPPEIRDEIEINSGYRSAERQKQLFDEAVVKYGSPEAARRWVAQPGRSQHNHGRAMDLGFKSDRARKWVHENAGKFDLHFPMEHEPWHIEPRWARGMRGEKAPSRVLDVIQDSARQTVR